MMHQCVSDKRRILHAWSSNIQLIVHPRLIDAIPMQCDDKCFTCRILFCRQAEPVLAQRHIGRRILTEAVAEIAVETHNHKQVRFEMNGNHSNNGEQQQDDNCSVWINNDVAFGKGTSRF